MKQDIKSRVASAIVAFRGGCGVLISGKMILTAAHCFDWASSKAIFLGEPFVEEIGTAQGLLAVEAMAVEPVSDIAVFRALDCQEFPDEWERFEEFCAKTTPLRLFASDKLGVPLSVCIYTHKKTWLRGKATLASATPFINFRFSQRIENGTSGSPIVTDEGEVVGIVSNSAVEEPYGTAPRPQLALPVWVYQQTRQKKSRTKQRSATGRLK